MKVKLCGMMLPEDIQSANRVRPDYIGFLFAEKSSRYVSVPQAREMKEQLDPGIQAVGVFVKEDPENIARLLTEGIIDIAQLHGGESQEYIQSLRELTPAPLIQAFAIRTAEDVTSACLSSADMILLDSGSGGSGKPFDWKLLKGVNRPYILAGGLSPDNICEKIKTLQEEGIPLPYALDVSSGIESNQKKDPQKMIDFTKEARKI